MDGQLKRWAPYKADTVGILRGDRGTWGLDMTPYASPHSGWKRMQQGEIVGDETVVRGDSDGA